MTSLGRTTATALALALALPATAAAQETGTQGAAAADIPAGGEPGESYWGAKRKVRVLQRRKFSKEGRFELGLFGGAIPNDPFLFYWTPGARVSYFFTESLAVGATYARVLLSPTELGDSIFDNYSNKIDARKTLRQKSLFHVNILEWTPLFGKMTFHDRGTFYFDWGLSAGFGLLETDVELLKFNGDSEIVPESEDFKVLFTLGGAEAVENAMKIARLYTGRSKIVTRYRSYHGATMGAVSAGGDPRRLAVEPGVPGHVRVLDPYCYRCPFGQAGPESCGRECIKHVEEVIRYEGPENVAAVLMEGVTGSSGIIIPPDDYWAGIKEICDRYGILIISDEVMSGFGRTGEWFGIDNYGVVPDIIAMAKGLTCGYVPLGAVAVREHIARYFDTHAFVCGLTYSGHPVGCAAALATMEVYEEEGLIENAKTMGAVLANRLQGLKETHPSVGDVRSIGLFGVVECVKDRATREPTAPWNAKPSEMGAMADVARSLKEQGLYTFVRWNWIFTVPPLTITEAQLDEGIAMIDKALAHADAAYTGAR